ncbi:MAG: hypothetical protein GY769_10885 [bacterium]|nr:hypothetical protein [bacterium]
MVKLGLPFTSLFALVPLIALAATEPPSLTLRSDGIQFPDGTLQTTAPGSYADVIIVAKSGGHFTSIQAALDSIPPPPVISRSLVLVAPGVYDEQVTMRPFVDIEGSGEGVTIIRWSGSTSFDSGTVVGGHYAELRSLTVVNTGGDDNAIAIFLEEVSTTLSEVSAFATGGIYNSTGIYIRNCSPTLRHVNVSAEGPSYHVTGVYNSNASPTMTRVVASASGGGYSKKGIVNGSSSSPRMTLVEASASGPSDNYGIENGLNASPTMINVTSTASGGEYNYGIYNSSSSSPLMSSVVTRASAGSARNVGIALGNGVMMSSSASASGPNENFGVEGWASPEGEIHNSRVSASGGVTNRAVYVSSLASVRVAYSQLAGAVLGSGVSCFGAYDENFEALGPDCQPIPPP